MYHYEGSFDIPGPGDTPSRNEVIVFRNNGNGTFAAPTSFNLGGKFYGFGEAPVPLATADFDNDGILDLVVAINDFGSVNILRNQGNAVFVSNTYVGNVSGMQSMVAADVNGDGLPDLAIGFINGVNVYFNQGGVAFTFNATYGAATNGKRIVLADMTGDGKADMVLTDTTAATVTVMKNMGSGSFGVPVGYATNGVNPANFIAADVNGDGRPDIVTANNTSNNISVMLNLTCHP